MQRMGLLCGQAAFLPGGGLDRPPGPEDALLQSGGLTAQGCDGQRVAGMSRQEGVCHVRCDVTDAAQVVGAVEFVLSREGKIDVLVNNAGFGISGAAEFTASQDAHRLMEVNLFGMVNLTTAVLPHMRRAGRGRIVNVSSVAAVLPIPFQAWYSVSKASINAYTMALANEVRPYGVGVCAVMPGDICTGFTAARQKSCAGDEEYGGRINPLPTKIVRPGFVGRLPSRKIRRTYPPYSTPNRKLIRRAGSSLLIRQKHL